MRIIPFSSNNGDCDSQISSFFSHFSIFTRLSECGGIKARGTLVKKIFSTIFCAQFKGKSVYRMLQEDDGLPEKDSVYRFMSMPRIDWNCLTARMAADMQEEMKLPESQWLSVIE